MTLKLSERELEKLLRGDGQDFSPPAGLYERLRADLPAELPAFSPHEEGPHGGEGRVLRPAVWWRRPLVTLAATLAVAAGASFVAWRGFREMAQPAAELAARPSPPPAADAPEGKQLQEEESGAFQDEMTGADRLAKKDLAADSSSKNEAARGQAPAPAELEEVALGVAGGRERRDTAPAPAATRRAPPLAPAQPAAPAPAGEAGGVTGGVPGGTVGGVIAPPPATPAEVPPPAATAPPAEPTTAAVTSTYEVPPPPAAAPQRLESPSIEANVVQSSPLVVLGDSDERRKTGHLENPALQSDAGRGSRDRAAALAAPPRQAGAALQAASWDPIERALVAGRWPTAAEVAAARPPKKKGPVADSAKESLVDKKESDAEKGSAKDSPTALREDLLDFFASEEKTPRDLFELRRRALLLAAIEPVDPQLAELLRALNFAARIATPIN
jgi:hypothetical protein